MLSREGKVGQLVEYLPSTHETLGVFPSAALKTSGGGTHIL